MNKAQRMAIQGAFNPVEQRAPSIGLNTFKNRKHDSTINAASVSFTPNLLGVVLSNSGGFSSVHLSWCVSSESMQSW